MQHWEDCNGDQSLGYDSTMAEGDSQHWFDTLEEAREFVEFSDEYIQDEDGRLSDKDGNWYGQGKDCSDCMGRGYQDSNIEDERCDTCDGTGEFLGDGISDLEVLALMKIVRQDRDMIATLKHELSKPNA